MGNTIIMKQDALLATAAPADPVWDRAFTVQCRRCDVLLVGREQFIGHMIHSHELPYEKLEENWSLLTSLSAWSRQ